MYSGIYCIKNIKNNKVYIGQSSDVFSRLKKHYNNLIRNKHINKHLQSSFNKYGSDNFEYSIICEVSVEQLDVAERTTIYMFTSTNPIFGFNKTVGGEGGTPTEETRRKISISKIGKYSGTNNPMFGKTGKNHPFFGRNHSEETRKKISISKSGQNHPMFGRVRESNPFFGKHHTNNTKQKLAELHSKIIYRIIKPNGQTEIIKNLAKFCRNNNLDHSAMSRVIKNKQKQHKGYRVEIIPNWE